MMIPFSAWEIVCIAAIALAAGAAMRAAERAMTGAKGRMVAP